MNKAFLDEFEVLYDKLWDLYKKEEDGEYGEFMLNLLNFIDDDDLIKELREKGMNNDA